MYFLTLGTIQQPPVRYNVLWRERSGQVNQLGQDLLLATREQVQVKQNLSSYRKKYLKKNRKIVVEQVQI